MNTKSLRALAAVAFLAVLTVSSPACRHRASIQNQDISKANGASEYKTVEVEESPDQAQATAQMKERMQQFQGEGWTVLSVSQPLPQSDGTIHRKYSLSRSKR